MGESLGHAVVDSGCSKTVCGKTWFEDYIATLDRCDTLLVDKRRERRNFRFGDGENYESHFVYSFPIKIGDTTAILNSHVIDCDIPLLLSRESLQKSDAKIDFNKDTICMFGQSLPMAVSSSGHLLLPLTNPINEECFLTSPINAEDITKARQQVSKIHKQFAHPRPEKLKKLIADSGNSDKNIMKMVDEITENCDICKKFKRPLPRPIVAMPQSTEFNETVAMDIKFINGHPILHLIDHVTRYSAASRINNKKPESVIQCILTHWIRIFGQPKYFLFDNGGEFDNNELKNMCEKFNIHIKTTAAESPWSNGLCERANSILQDMVLKIMMDTNCSIDMAIPWAISAKNSLANTYGFSPNQLVFGQEIKLPSVHHDLPPAQNTNTIPLVAKHLMALHKARQAFISQESCEKLRRALNRQTRTYSDFSYQTGDNVYYKRLQQSEWHGPAKVIGRDGTQYLLKHGSRIVRVHQCKMQPTKDYVVTTEDTNGPTNDDSMETPEDSAHTDPHNELDPHNESADSDTESETNTIENPATTGNPVTTDNPTGNTGAIESPDATEYRSEPVVENAEVGPPKANKPSKIPRLLARLADYNKPPTEDIYFGTSTNKEKFKEAKEEEVRKWIEMDVFSEVEDTGQPRISTRWVCTEKIKGNKTIPKARLVARGFEEDTSQLRSDSPTCSKSSLRVLLATIASKQWTLKSMDIKGAYLQGLPISRELFLQPPKGFGDGKIWKLKKTPYGLVDAGRKWYIKVLKELSNTGGTPSKHDKAMFLWKKDNNINGILIAHVDDFLYGGDQQFNTQVIPKICQAFQVGNKEEKSFKYTGLEITTEDSHLLLGTGEYCKGIEEIETKEFGSDRTRPLTQTEVTTLRSKAGQINWIAGQSRPDLAFDNCTIANRMSKPTVSDIHFANKIVRKIGTKNIQLAFPQSLDMDDVQLVAFCDASHANLPDRGSQGGFIVFLVDKNGDYCTVTWQSRKIKRIVNSTLAAECLAAVDTAENCLLLKATIKEITGGDIKVSLFSDNKSLVEAAHTSTQTENKRLQIDMGILREMLEKGELNELRWIDTKYQVANPLTKAGAPADYLLRIVTGQGLKFNFNVGTFA